jgi:hypothetical protein
LKNLEVCTPADAIIGVSLFSDVDPEEFARFRCGGLWAMSRGIPEESRLSSTQNTCGWPTLVWH